MATHSYATSGTCSLEITFELTNDIVSNIRFRRGCNGSAQGLAALAEGGRAQDLIGRLEGICCGERPTSCPDQLAKALRQALAEQEKV